MLGRNLVRPLEDPWREALDAVARSRGWPTSRDVAKLAARVSELSAAYNDPGRARAPVRDGGAARLGFSFPRDVPKGAAAVRELLAAGALPLQGGLRVLDLGAGLGAMTWGLVRARAAAGGTGPVDALWVDEDGDALDVGLAIAAAAQASASGGLGVRSIRASLDASGIRALQREPPFDAILLGHVLSELDVGVDVEARAAKHAAWLLTLVEEHLAPHGSLVVVEPALRDRTRHLHRVRDATVRGGATVFAPCLHAAPCPALAREGDWCHEDLRVDLPAWLVPVARAAGLRYEGLTYSYLVLRRDGATLADCVVAPPGSGRMRVVSDRMKSKGKLEMFLCGSLRVGEDECESTETVTARRVRASRARPRRHGAQPRMGAPRAR